MEFQKRSEKLERKRLYFTSLAKVSISSMTSKYFESSYVQEAQRAREEGERRKKERGYDRRYRDRYKDKYKRVLCLMCLNLFPLCVSFVFFTALRLPSL